MTGDLTAQVILILVLGQHISTGIYSYALSRHLLSDGIRSKHSTVSPEVSQDAYARPISFSFRSPFFTSRSRSIGLRLSMFFFF